MLAVAVLVELGAFGASVRTAHRPSFWSTACICASCGPNLQQDVRFDSAKQQVMDRYIALSGRAAAQSSGTGDARV